MKDIKDFILEAQDYWNSKYISKKDIIKFGLEALKNTKLSASDIMDEISQYEDPDDLDRAYEDERLEQYCEWEQELSKLIFDDDKYSSYEGDICNDVYAKSYDLLNELSKITGK